MILRKPLLPGLLVLEDENGRVFFRNGFYLYANQLTYPRLLIESSYTPSVKGVSTWRYSAISNAYYSSRSGQSWFWLASRIRHSRPIGPVRQPPLPVS